MNLSATRSLMIILLPLLTGTVWLSVGIGKENGKRLSRLSLHKPNIVDIKFINYNNWSYVMRNNGSYMYDSPDADGNHNNAGGEFPRGSGVTIVYAGGIYIGTLKNGIPVVSETEFATEFRPGRIVNSGVSFGQLKAEDWTLSSQKVYLIDRDNSSDWPEDALRDKFGNPALIADAQTWAVFNDLDTTLNSESELESPNPGLGIEVALESYAFNGPKIGDVVFMRYILTNKTHTDYTQTYFAAWSDPDVNNSSNDIVGTDTLRNMEYVYDNTNEIPESRAVGFDFLQGPVVHKAEIPQRDLLRNQNNKKMLTYDANKNRFTPEILDVDHIILGAVSSGVYAGGTDPIDNGERYNLMRGADKSSGILKSGCGITDYFVFRGNPLLGLNACDNLYNYPADQRIHISTGPFTIKAGESQEIWVGVVGATGADRLDAVANLFATDDFVQSFFDAGLPAPSAPPSPALLVTALDGKAVLTWQNNAETNEDRAGEHLGISIANGYSADYVKNDFQGYRVYRSLTGLQDSYELLTEYDIVDTLGIITNRFINTNNHMEIVDVNVGSNTGLAYHYIDSNLINGQNYFYSATAYDAQPYIGGPDSMFFEGIRILKPSGLPVSLESSILSNAVSAIPAKPYSSVTYDASLDSDRAIHTQGTSDGYVTLEIVDASQVRTLDYTIEFFNIPSDSNGGTLVGTEFLPEDLIAYRFVAEGSVQSIDSRTDDPRTFYDKNANGTFDAALDIALDETFFGTAQALEDNLYTYEIENVSTIQPLIIDGIRVIVHGPPPGFKTFDVIANAGGLLNPPAAGAATFQGFPSSDPDLVQDQQVNGSFWFIADWRPGLTTGSYANFVRNAVEDWNGWVNLMPYDFEYRFTASGQMAQFRNSTTLVPIPFEVWNVTIGTKLLVNILDDAGTGSFQLLTGSSADHPVSGGTNDPRTCRFYIDEPSDMSPGTSGYDFWLLTGPDSFGMLESVIGRQVFVNWNGGDVVTGIYNQPMPEIGTIFRINTAKPNSASDVFTFSSTANSVVTSKKDLKRALKDIKVVPNPFYKYSSFETQFDKLIKFTHLPDECTIRIFTVAGDLVKTIRHNASSNNDRVNLSPYDDGFEPEASATSIEKWDLTTANGRYVASGMYIALIESKAGKHFVKFAIIQ